MSCATEDFSETSILKELSDSQIDELFTGVAHFFSAVLERTKEGLHVLTTGSGMKVNLSGGMSVQEVWNIAKAGEGEPAV